MMYSDMKKDNIKKMSNYNRIQMKTSNIKFSHIKERKASVTSSFGVPLSGEMDLQKWAFLYKHVK